MNFKSEVIKYKPEEQFYPCLKEKCTKEGKTFIVLCSGPNVGVVVASEAAWFPVGYYSDKWVGEALVLTRHKVVLSNES